MKVGMFFCKSSIILLLIFHNDLFQSSAQIWNQPFKVHIEPGEKWWGGAVSDGFIMPFLPGYRHNLLGDTKSNQAQPLLLSSHGRYIWSYEAFEFQVYEDSLVLQNSGFDKNSFICGKAGNTLKDAYSFSSKTFFPPSDKMPDQMMFMQPQYNTWIELVYNQNQEDVLKYAHGIIHNSFPAGVIMIDDNWQEDYGKWRFHPGRFRSPKSMIDSLHQMGFKVMVWICPFISPDCDEYRKWRDEGFLIRELPSLEPAMIHWWNGVSAVLDLTNPGAMNWIKHQLSFLSDSLGIDGFKFDAGDAYFYKGKFECSSNISSNEHSEIYGQLGLIYPLNEFRAMWKMGGQPLAQRLQDKSHNWEDLQTLIPNIIAQGLEGYAFTCPDMIGGGEYLSFLSLGSIDQDLIVRSAQCHALMPMMQFSVAPWRVLDYDHLEAVKEAVAIRNQFAGTILRLAKSSSISGEPIVRSMEYVFPNQRFSEVKDQFLLGDSILVAPMLQKGTGPRNVFIPPGVWKSWNGMRIKGPATVSIKVPINNLPYYIRAK
jgi:alpha-glucosidase (family GH31 glycosyl hydrolase)